MRAVLGDVSVDLVGIAALARYRVTARPPTLTRVPGPGTDVTFPLALVPGVVARRWQRVWAERVRRPALEIVPVEDADQVAVLADGRARMTLARLPLVAAAGLAPDDLHVVRLYEERAVVLAPRDHVLAATEEGEAVEVADVAEELFAPDDLPAGMPWSQRVALAAAGEGLLVAPHAVARALQRKDLLWRVLEGAEPTTVALVWPRADDDPLCQELVGIVRGRTARSSR